MTEPAREDGRDGGPGAAGPDALRDPIGVIHADHLRERRICGLLDQLAGGDDPEPEAAASVLAFLREELPLHLEDEERDLFPLLRRRCEPEIDIARAIRRLETDRLNADEDAPEAIAVLEALVARAGPLSEEGRAALARQAAHVRRRLILENAVVLPLARLRLTAEDLETLRLRMTRRRGLGRMRRETAE